MSDARTEASQETSLAFFRERFGIDDRSLSAALGTALERRVDHADLFFEYTTADSVSLEEGIAKTVEALQSNGA